MPRLSFTYLEDEQHITLAENVALANVWWPINVYTQAHAIIKLCLRTISNLPNITSIATKVHLILRRYAVLTWMSDIGI